MKRLTLLIMAIKILIVTGCIISPETQPEGEGITEIQGKPRFKYDTTVVHSRKVPQFELITVEDTAIYVDPLKNIPYIKIRESHKIDTTWVTDTLMIVVYGYEYMETDEGWDYVLITGQTMKWGEEFKGFDPMNEGME